tara:strand:+ start:281 stop:643 length:363 start_codon:yes stop_codon:yes gene_type:complete
MLIDAYKALMDSAYGAVKQSGFKSSFVYYSILDVVKKLLVLLLLVPMVSCSGGDDDDTNSTTDPIIGNWRCDDYDYGETSYTVAFNTNGSYAAIIENIDGSSESQSENWTNSGSDLNRLS